MRILVPRPVVKADRRLQLSHQNELSVGIVEAAVFSEQASATDIR